MRQTVEIYDENKIILKELSEKLKLSETKIINEAIKSFSEKGVLKESDLEKIITAIEKSTWGLQVRLNAREAAIDSQVLLEIANTITQDNNQEFAPTYSSPSRLFIEAKKRIEDKINKRKANKKLL